MLDIDIHWQPEIGDPTPIGWFTVFAYFATALFCLAAASKSRAISDANKETQFWTTSMIIIAFLGFNKQLDLQMLFTEVGKYAAHSGGWYDQRHAVQVLFILCLSVLGAIAGFVLLWVHRKMRAPVRLASLGLCFLAAFIVARAAAFHHANQFLGETVSGLPWNVIFELGGIATVAVAGLWYRSIRNPNHSSR